MGNPSLWQALAVLVGVLCVPAAPAFLLYRFLPEQRIAVRGSFQGLRVNSTGAFAAYFLLVLVGGTVVNSAFIAITTVDDRKNYEAWLITGKIRTDGSFWVWAPVRKDGSGLPPILQVTKPPYAPAVVSLGDPRQSFLNAGADRVRRDSVRRHIVIDEPIILRLTAKPYDPVGAFNPQVVSEAPERVVGQ